MRISWGRRRRRRSNLPPWLVGPVFAVVGALVAIFGVYQAYEGHQFRQVATPYTAEVLSVEVKRKVRHTEDGTTVSVTYRPLVQFTDQFGVVHQKKTRSASSGYHYQKGERVGILFNPAQPRYVRMDSAIALWGGSVGLVLMGAVFFGLGLMQIRKNRAGGGGAPNHTPDHTPDDYGGDASDGPGPTVRRG